MPLTQMNAAIEISYRVLWCICTVHQKQLWKIRTTTPVIQTGVILTCRSPSPPAVASLSHGPCDCLASLSHLAKERPVHYWLLTFWPRGANHWAKVHQMGRWSGSLLDVPFCKISSPYVNMSTHVWDIRYEKFCGQTKCQLRLATSRL